MEEFRRLSLLTDNGLFPHDLHMYRPVSRAVQFDEEDGLPRAQLHASVSKEDRHIRLDHAVQDVGVGILLPRAPSILCVVAVVRPDRNQAGHR